MNGHVLKNWQMFSFGISKEKRLSFADINATKHIDEKQAESGDFVPTNALIIFHVSVARDTFLMLDRWTKVYSLFMLVMSRIFLGSVEWNLRKFTIYYCVLSLLLVQSKTEQATSVFSLKHTMSLEAQCQQLLNMR